MKTKQLPTDWKEVELGDTKYFTILSSGIKKFEGIKNYLSTESIQGTRINKIECEITLGERPSRANMQPILNSVWFAKMQSTLKVYSFDEDNKDEIKKYILSTGFAGIKVNEELVSPKYIRLLLTSKDFNELKDKLCTGSTQRGINNKFIEKILLILPPLKTQKQIVQILEKAEKLKQRREQADKLADEYLKSVFNEMFLKGKFKEVKIGKISPLQGGFAFKSNDYKDKGIALVKITNVWKDTLTWKEKTFVPEEFLEKYSNFELKENDLVLSMTRPIIISLNSVKIARVTKKDIPCLLNQRVGKFQIDEKKINRKYLLYFCYTDRFKRKIEKYCSTSLQPNVSSNQINSIKIPLPPLPLQQKFANIVEKVEKLKEKQKQSKKEINQMFDALMQKAFKGELV